MTSHGPYAKDSLDVRPFQPPMSRPVEYDNFALDSPCVREPHVTRLGASNDTSFRDEGVGEG